MVIGGSRTALTRNLRTRRTDPSGITALCAIASARLHNVAIRSSSRRRPAAWVGTAILVTFAGSAAADDPEKTAPAPAPANEPAPPVAYDALFRLPSDSHARPSEGAALDRKRWEERFAEVRGDLDGARAQLAKAQSDLESIAHKTDSWQMAAPGAQPTAENSPVSYKLRQDIRRYREEVDHAERRLRDLEVEASLAGVPADWRQPPTHVDAAPAPGS
jgi:hypothetical protein